ncbi:pyridoxal kinase PdxY [Dermacoccaceae bacterium W4C1]
MNILSIQSSVAYGHAGNSSAVFPLQRLGHEVWPVYTVNFSNHTGYGAWRGPVFAPETVAEVIAGIADRGVLPTCDAILTGYMGAGPIADVILDAVDQVKAANPHAIYCADPVMGDEGRGFFVAEGIPEMMRDKIVPAADILTPNQWELNYLTGTEVSSVTDLLTAANKVREAGPKTVLVTSVKTTETPADSVQMAVVNDEGAWVVTTPLLPIYLTGGGDATAAIFLAHSLTATPQEALARTADAMFAVATKTHETASRELQLIAAQDEIAAAGSRFDVTQLD